jgi:inosose dehydratase
VKLGYQGNAWGGVVGHPVGVTSIKDLLYLTPGDPWQALDDIAAAGFEGVELFDGNVVEHQDRLPDELAARGLALIGVYSGANFVFRDVLDDELWRIRRVCAAAAAVGAEHLIVGGGAQRATPGDDDYDRLASALDEVCRIAEGHGLVASYHPHMTTMAESPGQIERVLSRSEIGFCPDTGHLILGGGDPAALIREWGPRIPTVHIKDVTAGGGFVPLGEGVLDVDDVLAAVAEIGLDGWLTVELDGWDGDPAQAARSNREVLARGLGGRPS